MMNTFYKGVHDISETTKDLSEAQKTGVLFRVAIERGSSELGMMPTMHLLSRLMTTTLGIMAGDDNVSFEGSLGDFDCDELMPN
jgi:hypothetical protein